MKVKLLSVTSFCTVCALALCASFTSCKKKEPTPARTYRTLEEIIASGELRVAAFSNRPPLSWADENWEYHGFDVYFARQMAADLKVKPVFFNIKPADRVEALEAGEVDVAAIFAETEQRSERVAYSLPYMKVLLGVVSHKDALITSVDELRGKRLLVENDSNAERYFEANYPDVTLVKYSIAPQMYNALRNGMGDALAATSPALHSWIANNPEYDVGIDSIGEPNMIAAAVHKDNTELLEWINGEMRDLGHRRFFHEDFEATLRGSLGESVDPDDQIIEDWE